ncbi:MAG: T6SS phospholipase effector Tle1-like catalytic domain-containing protein [Polaribacter sp.]
MSIYLRATRLVGKKATKKLFSGINVKTAKCKVGNAEYEELIPEESTNITVGVFFDGTQNNRQNVNSRLEKEKKDNNKPFNKQLASQYIFQKGSSYENEYSNISRGEPFYQIKTETKNQQFSIYIEGAGTENAEEDDFFNGVAQGEGKQGVIAKANKAIKEVAKEIAKACNNQGVQKVNKLTIDTYGFSRGAATARYFVYRITKRKGQLKKYLGMGIFIKWNLDWGTLGEELKKSSIEVRHLSVRFVGLYDTVASFGLIHSNDTRELKLNVVGTKANNVFQIGADDEHRVNFRRTDIGSAIKTGRGKEVLFPGVHSDIGGGYKDNSEEKLLVLDQSYYLPNMREEKRRLVQSGWYNKNQLIVNTYNGKLEATRCNISNKYSYIPLQCMTEYSKTKKVDFKVAKLKKEYPIDGNLLKKVKTELDGYVAGTRKKMKFENPLDRPLLKKLRNGYFHFSAHWTSSYYVLHPNKPNRDGIERVREINPG